MWSHQCQLETSEFCFVLFLSYFSNFLYLFNGNDTLISLRLRESELIVEWI